MLFWTTPRVAGDEPALDDTFSLRLTASDAADAPASQSEPPDSDSQTEDDAQPADGESRPQRQWLVPGRPWEPQRPGCFHLDRLGGYIELEGRYEQERYHRLGARPADFWLLPFPRHEVRQRNTEWGFREKFGVELQGDIYHPNIFEYEGRFAFGFEQIHFREELFGKPQTDNDSGVLLDFDLRGRAFSGGALNAEVYARRAQNRIPRRFIPSLDEERTLYGVNFSLRSDIIPMHLTIEREKVNLDGDAYRYDEEETDEVRLNYGADVIFTEQHVLHLTYDYNHLEEDVQGSSGHFDSRRHEWTLEDELTFGRQQQHRLDTTLRLQQEDGDLARDLFEFTPRLTLKHSDSLSTYWTYSLQKENYDRIGFVSNRGEFTLVHQLYQSLTSTVNLFGQNQDFDDGLRTNLYGAGFREAYTKKNAWGTFRAELGYQWDQLKQSEGDDVYVRRQESGTFRDPLPIYLSEYGALRYTIVVTNPQRSRYFVLGRDYLVMRIEGRTVLHRLATGSIADGDTVLITYDYRRNTRDRIDTQRVDARLEQQFTCGLRPYYEFDYRRQQVRQVYDYLDFYTPDDLERHRVGIDYTKDRWFAGIEYEHEDRTVDPFDALHLDGRWVAYRDNRLTANVTGRYSHFNFTGYDEARDVDLLDLGVDTQFDVDPRLSGSMAAYYRWQNDSRSGVNHGVDVDGSLIYHIGRTRIELTAEYNLLTIAGTPDDGFGVWLRLRRELGDLLR
ncbi:MAG TPA: hypothetical protein VGM03_12115 [Phycisphaerae bacterium]